MRENPYESFKFRVELDGRYVAGFSAVGALKRMTEVVTRREGGSPHAHLAPATTRFEAVTLERGVTHDAEFERWANSTYSTDAGLSTSLADFRKDLRIELVDASGRTVRGYGVHRCWVSSIDALPELGSIGSKGTALAIRSMKLEHEGWELDPVEPG